MSDSDQFDVPVNPSDLFDPGVIREACRAIAGDRAWLVWTPVMRGNRTEKLPVDPTDGVPRAPNAARDRGVLTLEEAIEAATRLGRASFGIGLVPGRVTSLPLLAFDLDDVVGDRGVIRSSLWKVISTDGKEPDAYAELSPSRSGLRLLVQGVMDGRTEIGSGIEIGSVGVYHGEAKFVTVTGRHVGGPLDIVEAPALLERAVTRMRDLHAARGAQGLMLGYSGAAGGGEAAARAHILSGAALHEPLMHLGGLWARSTNLTQDQIEKRLTDLMDQSAARVDDESRWLERSRHIHRWTKGAITKFGSAWQKMERSADLTAAHEKIRGHIERARERAETERLEALAADGGPTLDGAEGDDPDAELDALIEWMDEQRVLDLKGMDLGSLTREQGAEPGTWDWALESMPSALGRDLALHVRDRQTLHLPGGACLAALASLSALVRGAYCAVGRRVTTLNLYAAALAGTGAGKSPMLRVVSACARLSNSLILDKPTTAEGMHQAFLAGGGSGDDDAMLATGPSPSLALVMDEWAPVMGGIIDGRANSPYRGGVDVLLAVFELADGTLPAKVYSTRRKAAVANPWVTTFGVSTEAGLERLLTRDGVRGGFINRHVIVNEAWRPAPPIVRGRNWTIPSRVPDDLREGLERIAVLAATARRAMLMGDGPGRRLEGGAETALRALHGEHETGRPWRRIEIAPDLYDRMLDAQAALVERLDRDTEDFAMGELASRAAQNMVKISALLRVGDIDPVLGAEWSAPMAVSPVQAEWAIRFVSQAIEDTAIAAADRLGLSAPMETAAQALARQVRKALRRPEAAARRSWRDMNRRGYIPRAQMMVWATRIDHPRPDLAIRALEDWGLIQRVGDAFLARHLRTKGAGRPLTEAWIVLPGADDGDAPYGAYWLDPDQARN